MKKLIFVDDENKVLDGLKRMLHRYRKEWDMTFVDNAAAALEFMEAERFDVIVSDMRMPGMDGAELLGLVKKRNPRTVRIVLSGHAEVESAMRVVPFAHQFLSKPCESEVIREIVSRACNLHGLMESPSLQKIVGGIDALPAPPAVYNALVAAMNDPEVGLAEVAEIVESDPSITAKILQLVNSSFFGVARNIASLREATSFLGMKMIRDITLSMEVFRSLEGKRLPAGFSIEGKQAHSALCGRVAGKLLDDKKLSENAFLAGMLHDVGDLIRAISAPDDYERCADLSVKRNEPVHAIEEQCAGVSHAEIGAYLLGLWGLPYGIVEAVANHHHPGRVEHTTFDVLGAVHVADALVHEQLEPNSTLEYLDLEYLEAIGVLDRLPEWREVAALEARAGQADAA